TPARHGAARLLPEPWLHEDRTEEEAMTITELDQRIQDKAKVAAVLLAHREALLQESASLEGERQRNKTDLAAILLAHREELLQDIASLQEERKLLADARME